MEIIKLHNQAMDISELADLANFKGNTDEALAHFEKAFELEKEAALKAYSEKIGEPTVSVLLRSAASLGLNCNKIRESEKLISLALSGEPPFEIAEELRDLLEMVHFKRHLDLKGLILQEDEVRMVISGKGVGWGMARSNDALNRINLYEQLAYRTIERKVGHKFRISGSMPKEIKQLCQSYMSQPIASSMAFVIKFGSLNTNKLPGFSSFEDVIDDISNNIELIGSGNLDQVKENIQDEAYFTNFVQATKALAPDGDEISLFGLTTIKNGLERRVELTKKQFEISNDITSYNLDDENLSKAKNEDPKTLIGILSLADISGKIKISDENNNNKKVQIIVPDGLSDIVKTYWEQRVSINYIRVNNINKLIDINIYND